MLYQWVTEGALGRRRSVAARFPESRSVRGGQRRPCSTISMGDKARRTTDAGF